MIDFACKRFNIDDIIKCGLGLTKAEFILFRYFIDNSNKEFNTNDLSKKLNLNLTTVQKGVKKLYLSNIIKRNQKNLGNGGYLFVYSAKNKNEVRRTIKEIINNWSTKVEESIDSWN